MFVSPATSRKREAPHRIEDTASKVPSSPPVFTPAAKHPVYGKAPIGRDGGALGQQHIEMLDYWHRKATQIAKSDGADAALARKVAGEICEAVIGYQTADGHDVAVQLQIILREMKAEHTVAVIGVDDFAVIANSAVKATAPLVPTKRLPALAKGRKLTPAGLLFRYHAYLIGELRTLSWKLYGCADYASQMRPTDDAVSKRCRVAGRNGRTFPLFNEANLPARARSVLRSLKIDAERTDTRDRQRTVRP